MRVCFGMAIDPIKTLRHGNKTDSEIVLGSISSCCSRVAAKAFRFAFCGIFASRDSGWGHLAQQVQVQISFSREI